jgi:hypothetical protein
MFRFAADEHGWPMRAVEHRPVACVPIPEKIGILRASQSAGHKPAGRTDWKQSPDVHPLSKNHATCRENLNRTSERDVPNSAL